MAVKSIKKPNGAVPENIKEIVAKLTPKQLQFCNFYLQGKSSKEAYRLAGYSTKGGDRTNWANSQALLQSQAVRAYIDAHRVSTYQEFSIDRHQFAAQLKQALFGEWAEEQVVTVLNDDGTTRPMVVKRAISPRDRIKAAEVLERVLKIVDDTPLLQSPETSAIVDFSQGVSKHSTKNIEIDTLGRSPSTTDATPPLDEDK